MNKLRCSTHVYSRAQGRAGLGIHTPVEQACGRPAHVLVRGIKVRGDGSIFLYPWSARCKAHHDPSWEAWIQQVHPGLDTAKLTAYL